MKTTIWFVVFQRILRKILLRIKNIEDNIGENLVLTCSSDDVYLCLTCRKPIFQCIYRPELKSASVQLTFRIHTLYKTTRKAKYSNKQMWKRRRMHFVFGRLKMSKNIKIVNFCRLVPVNLFSTKEIKVYYLL